MTENREIILKMVLDYQIPAAGVGGKNGDAFGNFIGKFCHDTDSFYTMMLQAPS